MSEQRPPHRPRDGHPDEALAAFTDGTATPDEHALVLAHLQGCAQCRRDVEAARRALDALATLPEPESPTLDPDSIVREAANVVGIDPGGSRRRGVARLGSGVVVGGLASGLVAAGIVFVLATGALKLGGGGASTAASGSGGGPRTAAPAESGDFSLGTTGTNYTRTAIDQLAAQEAQRETGPGDGAPAPSASPRDAALALRNRALSCTSPQMTDGSTAVSVVIAHFEGRPAFVAVLRGGGAAQGFVRVVVTDRTNCSVLYAARAAVPHG